MRKLQPEERFWAKVDKNGPSPAHLPELGGCWLWLGGKTPLGYGTAWFGKAFWRAHRLAYTLTSGPVSAELDVLHRCDIPACVRPEHLFLGTDADNHRDKSLKGRAPHGERHWRFALRDADVIEIRRRYQGRRGEIRALAKEFKANRNTISEIIRGLKPARFRLADPISTGSTNPEGNLGSLSL